LQLTLSDTKLDHAYRNTDMKLERCIELGIIWIVYGANVVHALHKHFDQKIRQESDGGTPTVSTDANPTRTSLADLPDISAPAQIGMIMPNPEGKVYAGQSRGEWSVYHDDSVLTLRMDLQGVKYLFGFVDPTPGPPEAQDGVLRQVTPLINFPNYTTSVFPPYSSLSTDPAEHVNDTQLEDTKGAGWCSVDLAPRIRSFEFTFTETGWHMYVINTTWARPTIVSPNMLRLEYLIRRLNACSNSFSPERTRPVAKL
jgi:hypothetical protein